jgi:hypothetical protein
MLALEHNVLLQSSRSALPVSNDLLMTCERIRAGRQARLVLSNIENQTTGPMILRKLPRSSSIPFVGIRCQAPSIR